MDSLSTYGREVETFDVLSVERERELARQILVLRARVWEEMLSYAPAVETVAGCIERAPLKTTVRLEAVRRAAATARARRSKAARDALRAAARKASVRLRDLDRDHELRSAVRVELEHHPVGRKPAFERYLERVDAAERDVRDAQDTFVCANLRLVIATARRYRNLGLSFADLVQEGNCGLLRAVERYDYRQGFRFSTYAFWWIRHGIGRALSNTSRMVRLPVHLLDQQRRMFNAQRDLAVKLEREPTQAELASAAHLSVAKVDQLQTRLLEHPISLDHPPDSRPGLPVGERFIAPAETVTPYDLVQARSEAHRVRALVRRLTPRQADILQQRFGLEDDDERTLQEIAAQYGVSRERIRQIQSVALARLRKMWTARTAPASLGPHTAALP